MIKFKEDFLLLFSSEQKSLNDFVFLHNVNGLPMIRPDKDQTLYLEQTMKRVQEEYSADAYGRHENLQCYLRILLNQIQRLFLKKKNATLINKQIDLIKKFNLLVSQNYITQAGVSFYAEKLGVSEFHLYDLIKKNTGRTPGQVIRSEIILEAKRSLVHTEMTMAEIGYSLNFKDPSYFSRFFKRETGQSPSTFRGYIQEKYQTFPD